MLIAVVVISAHIKTYAISLDGKNCEYLQKEIQTTYEQMRSSSEDSHPSTYTTDLKNIEKSAILNRNSSFSGASSIDLDRYTLIVDTVSDQLDLIPNLSNESKEFYNHYITQQLQYYIYKTNCLPAKTFSSYKKLYDKIISNLKKYWRNELSNDVKIDRLDMIIDKLDKINEYTEKKYDPLISYLKIEIKKYLWSILKLQS